MSYALFLDDDQETRFPPDKPSRIWVIASIFQEATEIVDTRGCPEFVSFDHDLGEDADGRNLPSGLDFAKWMVERHLDGIEAFRCAWIVHSQNPPGAQNIEGFLRSWERSPAREAFRAATPSH